MIPRRSVKDGRTSTWSRLTLHTWKSKVLLKAFIYIEIFKCLYIVENDLEFEVLLTDCCRLGSILIKIREIVVKMSINYRNYSQ